MTTDSIGYTIGYHQKLERQEINMSKSFAKLVKAEEAKAKREQAKQPYVQPLRPRSTVFKSKKDFSRQRVKAETRKAVANW